MNQVKNNNKYHRSTIVIHWFTAVLIIILFPLGKYMEGLENSEKLGLIKLHAFLGAIVLVLTLIRSWLFFKKERPQNVKTGSRINDKLIIWIHNLFYFLLFGLSFSGIATIFLGGYAKALQIGNSELIKIPTNIPALKAHGIMATIMMLLLLLHVIGVIKHYINTKENTLKRIF
ncbi:cytochrome b [Tenacibaculum amylolyticum]|uniref:cytochrome b n=1 Tax=Tenacibaculum amylolyticum TaxID=104269 RepID=UPI0038941DCA